MTLCPIFEFVETEMYLVAGEQSRDIAALGYDGSRLLVQFHRLPGIYAAPATREQFERLLDAESISVDFAPLVAEAGILPPGQEVWHRLRLQRGKPKRKK